MIKRGLRGAPTSMKFLVPLMVVLGLVVALSVVGCSEEDTPVAVVDVEKMPSDNCVTCHLSADTILALAKPAEAGESEGG